MIAYYHDFSWCLTECVSAVASEIAYILLSCSPCYTNQDWQLGTFYFPEGGAVAQVFGFFFPELALRLAALEEEYKNAGVEKSGVELREVQG